MALFATLVLAVTWPMTAFGYATFNDHVLKYGVGDQYYWIDSTATPHQWNINTAMTRWTNTSTPVLYRKTTTKSSSRMDHYKISTVEAWWAMTTLYNGSTTVNPSSSNWVWGKIRLAGDFASCPNRTGTTGHEQGHVMGLAHVSANNALMYTYIGDNSMIEYPTSDDVNGINHLY